MNRAKEVHRDIIGRIGSVKDAETRKREIEESCSAGVAHRERVEGRRRREEGRGGGGGGSNNQHFLLQAGMARKSRKDPLRRKGKVRSVSLGVLVKAENVAKWILDLPSS